MKQDLNESIDDYLRWRASQDYSQRTLIVESGTLRLFARTCGKTQTYNLTHHSVEKFFTAASRTRQGSTLAGDHGIIDRFLKWCRQTGRLKADNDPLWGRRRPRATVKDRFRIPAAKFPQLLDLAGEQDPRDRALVALLLYTLARGGEVIDLRVRDVQLDAGLLRIRVHKSRLEDSMPISAELDQEMRRWLTHYTQQVGNLESDAYLIPTRKVLATNGSDGKFSNHVTGYQPHCTIQQTSLVVKPILAAVGVPLRDEFGKPTYEGGHTLRRSGARALFDSLAATGYDHGLRVVQSMLHHKSMSMTEHYIGVTADRRSRDELIRGQIMYPTNGENVLRLAR